MSDDRLWALMGLCVIVIILLVTGVAYNAGYEAGQADGLNGVWHYELTERREAVAIDE